MITHILTRISPIILSVLVIFFHGGELNAQSTATVNNRGCGTGTLPAQFETWVQSITPVPGKGNTNNVLSVFNIPVIVHVIHNNETVNSSTATSGNNLNSQ